MKRTMMTIGVLLAVLCGGAIYSGGGGASVDNSTLATTTIEYEHHEVHSGSAYTVHLDNSCTNTGEMTVLAFNVPDTTKWPHLVASAHTSAAASFRIVEAPSIDDDEATGEKTPYNRNRNSAKTSILTSIKGTPVASEISYFEEAEAATANITTTTAIWTELIGEVGNLNSKSGGSSRGQSEFVLDQGGQYAIIITSSDDNDNEHHITLDWYEHTDKR